MHPKKNHFFRSFFDFIFFFKVSTRSCSFSRSVHNESVELVCQVVKLKSPISRRRCAMGRKDMILGNLLVRSHHLLICLLRTACSAMLAPHCSLRTACFALLAPHCLLRITCCILLTPLCLLCAVCFARVLHCAQSHARSSTQLIPSPRVFDYERNAWISYHFNPQCVNNWVHQLAWDW